MSYKFIKNNTKIPLSVIDIIASYNSRYTDKQIKKNKSRTIKQIKCAFPTDCHAEYFWYMQNKKVIKNSKKIYYSIYNPKKRGIIYNTYPKHISRRYIRKIYDGIKYA